MIMWHQMIVTFLNATATYQYFPRIRTVLATAWQGNIRSWRGRCVVLGTSRVHKPLTKPPPLPPQLFSRLGPVQCRFNRLSS